jgi:hypothetical protein
MTESSLMVFILLITLVSTCIHLKNSHTCETLFVQSTGVFAYLLY